MNIGLSKLTHPIYKSPYPDLNLCPCEMEYLR